MLCSLILLVTLGCSSMKPDDYADTSPEFDLFRYFEGKSRAWGIFQDRFGKLHRRFKVDIKGSVNGDHLRLEESFIYDDGATQQRVWEIERLDKHRYSGKASDIIGQASGVAYGSALQWQYEMNIQVNGSSWRVHFNDWMFLMDSDTLMNRASVTKYGIKIGEVILFFQKV